MCVSLARETSHRSKRKCVVELKHIKASVRRLRQRVEKYLLRSQDKMLERYQNNNTFADVERQRPIHFLS